MAHVTQTAEHLRLQLGADCWGLWAGWQQQQQQLPCPCMTAAELLMEPSKLPHSWGMQSDVLLTYDGAGVAALAARC